MKKVAFAIGAVASLYEAYHVIDIGINYGKFLDELGQTQLTNELMNSYMFFFFGLIICYLFRK